MSQTLWVIGRLKPPQKKLPYWLLASRTDAIIFVLRAAVLQMILTAEVQDVAETEVVIPAKPILPALPIVQLSALTMIMTGTEIRLHPPAPIQGSIATIVTTQFIREQLKFAAIASMKTVAEEIRYAVH